MPAPLPHTIDDERGVRDLMSRWVSGLGLDVRVASDANQALERLNERDSDLAVIDIMMPARPACGWPASCGDHPHRRRPRQWIGGGGCPAKLSGLLSPDLVVAFLTALGRH